MTLLFGLSVETQYLASLPFSISASIEERDRLSARRLAFGVHKHLVPSVQRDRFVIRVPDAPSHEDRRIAAHRSPVPVSGVRIRPHDSLVLLRANAARVFRADHHSFADTQEHKLPLVKRA